MVVFAVFVFTKTCFESLEGEADSGHNAGAVLVCTDTVEGQMLAAASNSVAVVYLITNVFIVTDTVPMLLFSFLRAIVVALVLTSLVFLLVAALYIATIFVAYSIFIVAEKLVRDSVIATILVLIRCCLIDF